MQFHVTIHTQVGQVLERLHVVYRNPRSMDRFQRIYAASISIPPEVPRLHSVCELSHLLNLARFPQHWLFAIAQRWQYSEITAKSNTNAVSTSTTQPTTTKGTLPAFSSSHRSDDSVEFSTAPHVVQYVSSRHTRPTRRLMARIFTVGSLHSVHAKPLTSADIM